MDVRVVRSLGIAGLGAFLASCGGSPTTPANTAMISLAATTVTFGAQVGGGNPTAQTVKITNTGTGTLSALTAGTITYGGGASGWLSASLTGASAPATITLNATTGSLTQGSYSATIPITGSGATNSPQSLKVTFLVFPPAGNTTLLLGQDTTFLSTPVIATNLVLQPGQQYLIAVVNTDASSAANEDFTLFGSMTSTQRVRLPSTGMARYARAATTHAPMLNAGPAVKRIQALRKLQANHLAMLDHNTAVFQRLQRTARSAPSAASARPRFAISQTVGTVNKIYIANAFGASCTGVDSIGARTVAVGQHVIVLADTNTTKWPSNLRDSAFYQTFANEYDATTFPHINTYIGNPLAYDSHLSNIGKITVVISPVLNNFGGGIVAFVNGCDFYPFDGNLSDVNNADLGNQTEVFYYWAPDTASGWTGKPWEDLMRGTAAHETKHIVSYTDRIINNGFQYLEQRWLEEGLAQVSAEIWERNFNNTTWKGHANFNQTVACELYLGPNETPACQDVSGSKPVALTGSHLPFLFDYLTAESQSPTGLGFGNTGGNATPTNYGEGWAFARWVLDQYATTEPSMIQSLVNEPTLSGLANVSSHTGKSIQELLVYWSLASAIYDTATYTAADVRTTIPTFNFGQIFYTGQTSLQCTANGKTQPCGLFGANYATTPVWPIQPTVLNTGAISAKVTGVAGTTAAYFLLTSTGSGHQYIQLQSGSGASINTASGLRIGIIRVQ